MHETASSRGQRTVVPLIAAISPVAECLVFEPVQPIEDKVSWSLFKKKGVSNNFNRPMLVLWNHFTYYIRKKCTDI